MQNSVDRSMRALEDRVSDINNSFTYGYKAKRTTFHDTVRGLQEQHTRDFNDGTAIKTNRQLDLALQGPGFFEIEMQDGTTAYTRAGSFSVSPAGQLVSSQGYYVVSDNLTYAAKKKFEAEGNSYKPGEKMSFDTGVGSGEIIIPTGAEVHISEYGELETSDGKFLGKLSIVAFPNNDGLQDVGDGVYIATDLAGDPEPVTIGILDNQTRLRQGYLEKSNVDIVDQMADMNALNTHVKSQMKIIKMLDRMQEDLNQTITRNI